MGIITPTKSWKAYRVQHISKHYYKKLKMSSLLQSTLNTRALPTGDMRFIRSDFPGKLTDDEVYWLRQNGITTIIDLRGRKEYAQNPCRLESAEGFTYYHLPVTGGGDPPDSPEAVATVYLKMIDDQMDRINESPRCKHSSVHRTLDSLRERGIWSLRSTDQCLNILNCL